jgi:hypothetical protein
VLVNDESKNIGVTVKMLSDDVSTSDSWKEWRPKAAIAMAEFG